MLKKKYTYPKYINSGKLAELTDKIYELEDEFRLCRSTKQFDKAALIECALGDLYKLLMHDVKRQGLSSIQVTHTTVKVTFNRDKIIQL